MNIKPIGRKTAIRALCDLDEEAFGHDKGSGEAYMDWATGFGLCESWDPEDDENWEPPPDFYELLVAAGISPDEIIEATGCNPGMFPEEMRNAYKGNIGDEGVRDPEHPCEFFSAADDKDESCYGDGHYLCLECSYYVSDKDVQE